MPLPATRAQSQHLRPVRNVQMQPNIFQFDCSVQHLFEDKSLSPFSVPGLCCDVVVEWVQGRPALLLDVLHQRCSFTHADTRRWPQGESALSDLLVLIVGHSFSTEHATDEAFASH